MIRSLSLAEAAILYGDPSYRKRSHTKNMKRTIPCDRCDGTGKISSWGVTKACTKCGGEGKVVERVDESGTHQTKVLNE